MVGGGRSRTTRREGGGDRLWAEVARPLRTVRVAVIACGKNRSYTDRRETTKNDGV